MFQKSFRVSTKGHTEVIDLTPEVQRIVAESGVREGIVNVAGRGSTLAVTTIEFEPGAVADLQRALEKIAPSERARQLRASLLRSPSTLRTSGKSSRVRSKPIGGGTSCGETVGAAF